MEPINRSKTIQLDSIPDQEPTPLHVGLRGFSANSVLTDDVNDRGFRKAMSWINSHKQFLEKREKTRAARRKANKAARASRRKNRD